MAASPAHDRLQFPALPGREQSRVAIESAPHQAVRHDERAEEPSGECEALFRAIAATAADAIILVDAAGKVGFWNPAAERIFGHAQAEALGMNVRELIAPSGLRPNDEEAIQRVQATGEGAALGRSVDVQALRKDGTVFAADVSLSAVELGGRRYTVGIVRDVTRQHETTQVLMHDRILLRTLIDALPDRIYAKDREARKTLANLADVRAFGVATEGDVLGKTDFELLDLDTAAACYADDLRVITCGEEVVNRQELIISPDGRQRWLATTKLPLLDDLGQIVGLVGIGHDITERKRAEAERSLMEIHLRQAQKLESIGQLAAGIAHEINTPMQYIGDNTRFLQDAFEGLSGVVGAFRDLADRLRQQPGMAEVLAPVDAVLQAADVDYLLAETPRAIEQSLEGADRVTKIVRAMKEFSHPGSEQKTDVDLNRAIESTITVARNEWKYVADLETDLDPELPSVPCLPGEFNQVLLNLIINAAHAIADVACESSVGKGRVTIRTRQAGEWAEIRVEDTGTGIPEAARGRIFDPFFTTKSVGEGSGQGLAIARSVVVDKHGGTLTFETEMGRGTTFIIRLPLTSGDTARAIPEA